MTFQIQNNAAQAVVQYLEYVVQQLRQAGRVVDEEGELTDRLDALLSKLRAPVVDEPPGGTRWPVLRAMARNYTAGKHTWDALDANACEQAAEEIRHLRAALASAPAANDLTPAGMKEICPECGHQFGCFHSPYIDKLRALASAPVAGEALFWYRPRSDGWYEGPIHNDRIEEARKRSGAWVPLVAAPQAGAHGVGQTQAAAYLTLDEEGSPCMLFFDLVEARGYCAPGEEPEPLFRHAAPQASVLAAEYARGRSDGFDAGRNAALELAAAAVENHARAGRGWIPGSLWDTLSREASGRIRALKQFQTANDGAPLVTDILVVLPPLPAELRDTETDSRAYARAAVLADRLQRANGGEKNV
ncbi:hypothetical protein I6I07_19260 [Achromobacter deleyi]|uniref:Uncharacterized protein n=1 Tax=Achromobacter deleyi TaxID=1353891 RepID=A0A7T4E6B9_9BURK|nr:hypothetical protein [Achromobacter deleyi]QQB38392.1 hypothetical protein I6I07_19260 [Achromobacter deleyi]